MGRKLVVYMIDDKAYGPRTAEIGNWSGKAIFSPRANIDKIINRKEFAKPGVYCLRANSVDDIYQERVYIGEAEKIGERLRQHLSKRDFSEYIGFINKDESLTKSHVKYLESRLVEMAKEAKSADIENSTAPSKPMLPESDVADMEFYLEQIKLILPLMGFNFLIPSVVIPSADDGESCISQKEVTVYTIKAFNLNASMIETDDGYIVLKGSEAKSSIGALSVGSTKRREKLILDQTLVNKGNALIFTQDTIFTSVSTAATMILAREANGRIEWVDQNGRTYKENAKEI